MPVFKQGDRYIYLAPTPYPCPFCGVSIVAEYGYLDAGVYARGLVLRHLCPLQEIEPLNQRQWELEKKKEMEVVSPPRPQPTYYRRRLPAQRLDESWLL